MDNKFVDAIHQCRQLVDGINLWVQRVLYPVIQSDVINERPVKQITLYVLAADAGNHDEQKHKVLCAHK